METHRINKAETPQPTTHTHTLVDEHGTHIPLGKSVQPTFSLPFTPLKLKDSFNHPFQATVGGEKGHFNPYYTFPFLFLTYLDTFLKMLAI